MIQLNIFNHDAESYVPSRSWSADHLWSERVDSFEIELWLHFLVLKMTLTRASVSDIRNPSSHKGPVVNRIKPIIRPIGDGWLVCLAWIHKPILHLTHQ